MLFFLLLEHIPQIKDSQYIGRPFKVVITISASSTISPIDSNYSLIWDILVKDDCMVSEFWAFTLLRRFLKVIFLLIFLPSNRLDRASNISFGVLLEDTWEINLALMESTIILLALIISFLCLDLASPPYGSATSSFMNPSRPFSYRMSMI